MLVRGAWLLLVLCIAITPAMAAERRVALVIGNSNYVSVGRLANPKGDAEAIAGTLAGAGFEVTSITDVGRKEILSRLRTFSRTAGGADVALVYFAGHGMEYAGQNWLVPVDATITSSDDIESEAIALDRVRSALADARRLRVVILDACRENPFLKTMAIAKRSVAPSRGLARVEAAASEIIAYAAAEGKTASDGERAHSPYTEALLKRLTQPDVDVRRLFGYVFDDVRRATAHEKDGPQEPAVYFPRMGGDDVALVTGASIPQAPAVVTSSPAPRPEIDRTDPDAVARSDYDIAKGIGTVAAWDRFLKKYPSGYYADMARDERQARIGAAKPTVVAKTEPAQRDIVPKAEERMFSVRPTVSLGVLNMRSGPGQQHSLVSSIPAGSGGVAMGRCQPPDDGRSTGQWCLVRWNRFSGWVSSNGLVPSN